MPRKSAHPLRVYAPGERKGKPWCVLKGRLADGSHVEKLLVGITDPQEARSIADEYYRAAEAAAAEHSRAPARPRTFAELAQRYAEARRIAKSEQRYVNRLLAAPLKSMQRRLGEVPLDQVSPALAQEAAVALYQGRSAKTMNRAALAPFAAIVHFAAENTWLPYLRVKGFKIVDRRTPRLVGGEDDARRLLDAAIAAQPKKCDKYKTDHPYRFLLLLFLFRQGWRISETLRLTWAQVDLVNGRFCCIQVDKGSAVKNRIVMHPEVFEALANLPKGEAQRAARERRNRVFPWVNRHNVYRWLKPFCLEVGIHFRPHMARVEFASQLSEAGQTDTTIKDTSTWTDTRSVARYTRTGEDVCAAAVALVGRRIPRSSAPDDPPPAQRTVGKA